MIKMILKKLANLKLAIFLLLLIAFTSSLGSIIEQDRDIDFYQNNYQQKILFFNISLGDLLVFLNLDRIYTTWWFFLFLFLFSVCLISCTFLQQFPALKFAKRYYFNKNINKTAKLDYKFKQLSCSLSLLITSISQKQYSLFQQDHAIYAYKGLISRIGPILVHFSIICILLGSILSSIGGFNAQEFVPKTEIFHIQNIIKNGAISYIPQKSFRINDFWSTYTKLGEIKQFHSNISILNGYGKEIFVTTLSVNKPLNFHGLTFYQTDWGINGLRIELKKKNIEKLQLPLSRTLSNRQRVWVSWIPLTIMNQKGIFVFINNNRGQIQIYDSNGKYLNLINMGDSINLDHLNSIRLVDLILSSGIQIKADPGIFIIYCGFFGLIFSSFISYLSFSELWVFKKEKGIFLGGRTNRAKLKFEIEVNQLEIYNE